MIDWKPSLILKSYASMEVIEAWQLNKKTTKNGDEGIIQQALTKSSNVNRLLSWAASRGHEAIVKQLLAKGADLPLFFLLRDNASGDFRTMKHAFGEKTLYLPKLDTACGGIFRRRSTLGRWELCRSCSV